MSKVNQVFTDEVRRSLARKAGRSKGWHPSEVPLVSLGDSDPTTIPVVFSPIAGGSDQVMLNAVDAVCEQTVGARVEFAVVCGETAYLVNTEGADYARCIGRLSESDSALLVGDDR